MAPAVLQGAPLIPAAACTCVCPSRRGRSGWPRHPVSWCLLGVAHSGSPSPTVVSAWVGPACDPQPRPGFSGKALGLRRALSRPLPVGPRLLLAGCQGCGPERPGPHPTDDGLRRLVPVHAGPEGQHRRPARALVCGGEGRSHGRCGGGEPCGLLGGRGLGLRGAGLGVCVLSAAGSLGWCRSPRRAVTARVTLLPPCGPWAQVLFLCVYRRGGTRRGSPVQAPGAGGPAQQPPPAALARLL